MAGLTLDKVYGALKRGRVDPVYYLTGSEDILKDELIEALVDRVVDAASRDFNVDSRAAGDLDGESLHALVETPPMLADRRIVVVRGLDQWRKNAKVWKVLRKYLEHPSPTTVLILTSSPSGKSDNIDKGVAGAAIHVDVAPLKPTLLRRWLAKRAERAGLQLEPDAADHLATVVGGDLSQLAQEIEKLAVAAGSTTLTVEDIGSLVGVRRGETVHDLVDAILARDIARAATLVEIVLTHSKVTGVQLVMVLGTALIGARMARSLLDAGTSPGRLEGAVFQKIRAVRPMRLRRWGEEAASWSRAARRWQADELDRFIADTFEADRQLKTTTISDPAGVLRGLMVRAAPRAAA